MPMRIAFRSRLLSSARRADALIYFWWWLRNGLQRVSEIHTVCYTISVSLKRSAPRFRFTSRFATRDTALLSAYGRHHAFLVSMIISIRIRHRCTSRATSYFSRIHHVTPREPRVMSIVRAEFLACDGMLSIAGSSASLMFYTNISCFSN